MHVIQFSADLKLPVLLICSEWLYTWRARTGGGAGIPAVCWCCKKKKRPLYNAQCYSSVRAKPNLPNWTVSKCCFMLMPSEPSEIIWCIFVTFFFSFFLGVLLGLAQGAVPSEQFPSDTTLPWLHLSRVSAPADWLINPVEAYIVAKQGKSLRYQLWKLETVAQSNSQLREMDPQRASDGSYYVLPPGGVEEGLAGQVVLLYTSQTNWSKERTQCELFVRACACLVCSQDWTKNSLYLAFHPVGGRFSLCCCSQHPQEIHPHYWEIQEEIPFLL